MSDIGAHNTINMILEKKKNSKLKRMTYLKHTTEIHSIPSFLEIINKYLREYIYEGNFR